ncbi:MAG: flagellar basal body protein [Ignavibacteriota bacterium]
MLSLSSAMSAAGGALDAYTEALDVVQNNVANSSTPGYAKQTQALRAMQFDPNWGSAAG